MATQIRLHAFPLALAHGKHNLGADSLMVWLSTVAPSAATASTLADIAQVDYTYCSSRAITVASSAQTDGTYRLVLDDLTITATGGAVGPFRYVGVYNDTAAAKDLVSGFYDYGSSITLADGESLVVDFDGAAGFFTNGLAA